MTVKRSDGLPSATAEMPVTAPPTSTEPFGARLRRAMDNRGPLCVGIDPHPELLVDWGLRDDVAGLERFCATVVGALADQVAVLKPQSAFFERYGWRGVAVLERTVTEARDAGALVLLDAKRGDIGSTMRAYAEAYLGPAAPLFVDAVTLSPYLGFGSLGPALEVARSSGSGVFVLARTSNPEGGQVQCARTAEGRTVTETVLEELAEWNDGAGDLGSFGAVVGATLEEAVGPLQINGPLLAPGLGAQGAVPEDLARVFEGALGSVLPSVSRDVLRAGPSPEGLREVVRDRITLFRQVLA